LAGWLVGVGSGKAAGYDALGFRTAAEEGGRVDTGGPQRLYLWYLLYAVVLFPQPDFSVGGLAWSKGKFREC
jgi:hypothetical protein